MLFNRGIDKKGRGMFGRLDLGEGREIRRGEGEEIEG